MRAVSRFWKALAAGALALGAWPALAQQAPAPTTNTSAVDTIGPRELQNFSLNGTVTRAADQPVAVSPRTRPARAEPKPAAATAEQTPPSEAPAVASPKPRRPAVTTLAQTQSARTPPAETAADTSPSLVLPQIATATPAASTHPPTLVADPVPPGTLSTEHKFALMPWLLAALALGAGGAFLFFRSRGREAFAAGPHIDAFQAPAPAPAPRPTPAPPAAAPKPATPASTGIVSTRLRPWVEIGFQPVRCVLEPEKITVDFEIELSNSGSVPARAVLVEASLFNAGPDQDEQIAAFFAKPVSGGDRIDILPPMQRMALRTQISVPTEQMTAYELGGRPVLLPMIAFNAVYKWGAGDGQTSASYLLGRDTKSDKMGPFRLDLGPRIFRGVGARLAPSGIRR